MESYLNLKSLLLDLSNTDDAQIEEIGYRYYRELFLDTDIRGIRKTHDGEDVYFWEERFDHAFFAPADWRTTTEKQVIDKARVARIKWILPLITGEVPNSECWLVKSKTRPDQRLYVRFSENYIVWSRAMPATGSSRPHIRRKGGESETILETRSASGVTGKNKSP